MERRLAGLSAIKGWLDENSVEELYRRADYKKKHDVKGLVAECKNFAMLTSGIFGQDNVLMDVLARYHDVGRLAQYDLLGYEDDEKLSHNALGLDSLDRFIEANGIKVTPDIQVLRDVIYYHGRDIKGNLNISERSRRYIEQISAIEAIDNESIRTVFNLEKIIQNDYRGYNKEYPEYLGKIRSEIYSLFKNRDFGEKRYFLKSYAEEILVSIMKTMNIIKKYGYIARKALTVPNYHNVSALAGYNYLVHEYIDEDLACEIEIVLRKECFNPIEHTVVPDDEKFRSSGEKFLEEIFDFLRGKGMEELPSLNEGERKVIELDDFWELTLLNLDGKKMCFYVKYFSNSSEKDQYTMRFTIP